MIAPEARATVPEALAMASVWPLASGPASLISESEVTKPNSNPRRKRSSPVTPTSRRSSALSMMTSPTPRVRSPPTVLRSFPSRSANAAVLELATSSTAPKVIAIVPRPPVETPNASSSQLPDTTNTDNPAIAIIDDPAMTNHARPGIGALATFAAVRGSSPAGAGPCAGRVTATRSAASRAARAMAANGPRQPTRLIRTAIRGAPMSKASAHDVSKKPIERARQR